MGLRRVAVGGSLAVVAASIALWATHGLNLGIDFRGGTQVVVKAAPGLTADDIRARFAGTAFSDVPVQRFGDAEDHEFVVRVSGAEKAVSTTTVNAPEADDETQGAASRLIALLRGDADDSVDVNALGRTSLAEALRTRGGFPSAVADAAAERVVADRTDRGGLFASLDDATKAVGLPDEVREWLGAFGSAGSFTAISTESVGPAVGAELQDQARRAVIWSILAILLYITVRFELRFALAAVLALAHDVAITIGILALVGVEFNISTIAALLTIVGYSLNDTIVVFDRVRENLRAMRQSRLVDVLDTSINQTLSRTLLTSGTTVLVVVALLVLGGPVLYGFAFCLTIGIVVGTYSSIWVASPFLLLWERRRQAAAAKGAAA
jgi:preprotein translocase SecF subunit